MTGNNSDPAGNGPRTATTPPGMEWEPPPLGPSEAEVRELEICRREQSHRARQEALRQAREVEERRQEERTQGRRAHVLARDLGPRYAPDRVTLENFSVYHPAQRAVLDRLPERLARGEGLILYGSVGAGKDHLLAALLHQAVARHHVTCRWVSWPALFETFRQFGKKRQDPGGEDPVREYCFDLGPRVAAAILAISDPIPPAGPVSDWCTGQLLRLLDRRYRNLRPIWVTCNAESVEAMDEALTAPVFDRLREGAEIVPCFWPSYRERPGRGGA